MCTITSALNALFRPDHWALRPEDSVVGMAGRDWTRVGEKEKEGFGITLDTTGYLLAYGDAVLSLDAEGKK